MGLSLCETKRQMKKKMTIQYVIFMEVTFVQGTMLIQIKHDINLVILVAM